MIIFYMSIFSSIYSHFGKTFVFLCVLLQSKVKAMNKKDLIDILKSKKSAPFLFLGSGFTKHYLNTPDWKGLLAHFASKHINAYITSLKTQDLSVVATEIAKETNDAFWKLPEDDSFKQELQDKVHEQSSVLKHKIAKYLKDYTKKGIPAEFAEEIKTLQKINIDGIITTNWDDLAETIFPKMQKYVGQEELIFSSAFSIGEIYKIHGCIHQPDSMVLTHEDYEGFNERNAYLAAKLITIFIEHPIIFIGYSINDPNIKAILKSIIKCMNKEMIEKLQNNLFFVIWNTDEKAELAIEKNDISMDAENIILPVTKIFTHDFKPVYECLTTFERGIPAHLLRIYKKQFYEIVYSEKPERKLLALPDKAIDANPNIQVVYGFGAINKFNSAIGYTGLKTINLFRDVIENNGTYESESILTKTVPELHKGSKFIPIYKYLREVGITSDETYTNNQLGINFELNKRTDFQKYPSFSDEEKSMSLSKAIETFCDCKWKAVALIPYLDIKGNELSALKDFISQNFNDFLVVKNAKATFFRKLVCFYDWLKYGWI